MVMRGTGCSVVRDFAQRADAASSLRGAPPSARQTERIFASSAGAGLRSPAQAAR